MTPIGTASKNRVPWPEDAAAAAGTARVTVDPRGTVTGWNESARRLLGYTSEEIVGRQARELLAGEPSAESPPFAASLRRWDGSVTLLHQDGHSLTVRLLAHRRTQDSDDAEGGWFLFSALAPDSSPSKDVELVKWAFAGSPATASLYDANLRLRLANSDMERAVGLSEEAMRGLRVSEIVADPQAVRTERHMRRVLETGEPDQVQALLKLADRRGRSTWTISLAPVLDPGGSVRGVLASGRDMTEEHRARNRLVLINEASVRIGTTLDLDRTAQELAEVAVPRLADFVTVDLVPSIEDGEDLRAGPLSSPVRLRRVACRSVLEGCPEAVVAQGAVAAYPRGSPAAECLSPGRPLIREVTPAKLAVWEKNAPDRAERVRKYGFHSVLAVPMRARGITLGAVTFSRHRRPEPFEQDDLLLAEEITARAAVCIDNARRYGRERRTSLTLQSSFLPGRPPQQAAVEIATRYLPASARAGVGGDWFDVIPLSGARVALVVGDVVGHGIQASAAMGRLRTAVRTLADVDLPPDELLTHLDDLVIRLSAEADSAEVPSGDIGATMLYVVYDPVTRLCTLARAGHPVPALMTPEGGVEFIDIPVGPPLGVGGLPFETTQLELPVGSVLTLYTNGLVEARDRDPEEGANTLREVLARPAESLEERCDTVLRTLLPDPDRPADDVALLMARTRAMDAAHVATWDVPHEAAAVAKVRKDACRQLGEWGLDDAVFITELVVSELVTNAIRYGDAPIRLRLIRDRNLIIEVADGSSTAPHLRRARVSDEGGRGLLLVAQLTQGWGTRQTYTGKTIWAEQSLTPI
ncbi:Phosphoserine phosphatase RsbU [Streptomyces sp. S4.7]|uniref:SpoIIE family protein phosphatase n=1 Tax=Streptomyces sp. S4.7 TaxID=2705439 RepID=UPI0013988980|nr:SpoIIE family protein phosphatase [Streptomyces sp. S4.7]QHY97757.1 Phosphoserine phosphatase RsbU [Streptomyces sp. S4.7]